MFKEIIIVEGKNDEALLKSINKDYNVFTTNGSAVLEKIDVLINLSKTNDLVLLLDPDYPGEKIRKEIDSRIKNVKHIFIPRDLCINKKKNKIGIEHCKKEILKEFLENALTKTDFISDIELIDLYILKLIGHKDSNNIRKYLSSKLNIGYTNGKTLLKRLKMFNINLNNVITVLKEGGYY